MAPDPNSGVGTPRRHDSEPDGPETGHQLKQSPLSGMEVNHHNSSKVRGFPEIREEGIDALFVARVTSWIPIGNT